MEANIATWFRDRYPAMQEHHRARCKAKLQEFNRGTQEGVWRAQASYEAIEPSLG